MLKCRFRILILPTVYSPEVETRIPVALSIIHNIIWELDSSEGSLPAENISFGYGGSDEDIGGNNDGSNPRRDKIAKDMWKDYQRVLTERELLDETDEDAEQELFDSDEWDREKENYQCYVQILSTFIMLLNCIQISY